MSFYLCEYLMPFAEYFNAIVCETTNMTVRGQDSTSHAQFQKGLLCCSFSFPDFMLLSVITWL